MRIINYRILVSGTRYTAPEARRFHLQGNIEGGIKGPTACLTSSPIVGFIGNQVTTRSGSVYELVGAPDLDMAPVMPDVQVYVSMTDAVKNEPHVPLT